MYPGSVTRLTEKTKASADAIDADADVILLTGTTTINTITPKTNAFAKAATVVYLIALDGSITLGTSGNIAVGGTILQNRYAQLIYSPTTGDWHLTIVA
jgi:hypothetical protein